ncbi:MAG: sodium:proton antiporter, partial [Marinobacter sp.]|nr:sodium:proton antiporter [Marinobacter sp.]
MGKPCTDQCSCDSTNTPDKTPSRQNEAQGDSLSVYTIPKMDCPSEERMIRMALAESTTVGALFFDLPGRKLEILHDGPADPITDKLATLGLGATLEETREADQTTLNAANQQPTEAQEAG